MLTRIAREKKKKRNGNNELEFFFFFVATKNRSIDDFSTRRSESSSIGTDLSITKSIYATMNIRPPRRIESCTVNHAQTIIIFALRVRRTKKKKREKDYQGLSAQRRRIDRDPITCPSRVIKNKVYRGEEVEIIGSLKRGRSEQL